jgi:DNA gyrase subunit B
VSSDRSSWPTTTHDWSQLLDREHIEQVRLEPARHAPGGPLHLVLEVLAYAIDEAADGPVQGVAPRALVALHADGSISVEDNGRGTDTRADPAGQWTRKPVMATKDVRFFESASAPTLSDGHPRRGMSVVSALSSWLVHTNRRARGSWTQRYELGIPVTDLVAIPADGTTGTTVHFQPDPAVFEHPAVSVDRLRQLVSTRVTEIEVQIEVEVEVERDGGGPPRP